MVSTNIDVPDGLFNGATGILKNLVESKLTSGGKGVSRAFVEFAKRDIGTVARQSVHGVCQTWTPVDSQLRVLNSFGHYQGLQIVRRQVPLIPANAITIHKSQGSSIPEVAVNITKRGLKREALYVACSRAPTLQGLYINGTFTAPKPISKDNAVKIELERLSSLSFPFKLPYLPEMEADNKLVFHNVGTFRGNSNHIEADINYPCADILAFCETKTLENDVVCIRDFVVAHRANSP